ALVIARVRLGMAASTVLGGVAYGVLLKPLPWADAPRLVRLYETRQGSTRRFGPTMTNITYRAWHDSRSALDGIGAWSPRQVTVGGQPTPERITITAVTPDLLSLLNASPTLGRLFAPGEEEPARSATIILSYGFWKQH